MTRVKKSRKVGSAGSKTPTRDRAQDARNLSDKRAKRHKGKPAGSRQSAVSKGKTSGSQRKAVQDQRLGSRKPIPLSVETIDHQAAVTSSVTPAVTPASRPEAKLSQQQAFPSLPSDPEQALAFIEDSDEFNRLLDLVDDEVALDSEQQRLFDWYVAQHQQLAEELGLTDEELPESDQQGERDLMDELEQGQDWLKQLGAADEDKD